jgi:methylase of polypeptide subunit release factors
MAIAELILSNIEAGGMGNAFDPCCGDGSPLALIGRGLGLKTYGSEIHPGRAAEAAKRLDHVVVGAREFLMLDGLFDVLLDNPPYDRSIAGRRMEIEHVLRDLNQIELGGLAIFIDGQNHYLW